MANSSVQTDHVNPGKTDQSIDDTCKCGCIAEDSGDKIEVEEANQPPVDRTDDGDCKSHTV